MKNLINGFTLYSEKKNNITYGYLYTKEINIPFSEEKKRTLRVWIPETYDNKKRFPVIYMTDGQNIVDKYTSKFGEWNMEEHVKALIEKGKDGYIVVGLDSPSDSLHRFNEYSFKGEFRKLGKEKLNPYGDLLIELFVHEIKPLIDKSFLTIPNKTGFVGSSMGGLFSFVIANRYKEIFNFALVFSPAFSLIYKQSYLPTFITSDISKLGKLYFFNGGRDLEKELLPGTEKMYKLLLKFGMDPAKIMYRYDYRLSHNEKAWSKYVLEGLEFVDR